MGYALLVVLFGYPGDPMFDLALQVKFSVSYVTNAMGQPCKSPEYSDEYLAS